MCSFSGAFAEVGRLFVGQHASCICACSSSCSSDWGLLYINIVTVQGLLALLSLARGFAVVGCVLLSVAAVVVVVCVVSSVRRAEGR